MASSIDELEEQVQGELGTIRRNQLEEITRSYERDAAARRFRHETNKTLEAHTATLAELKAGEAITHKALALLLGAQGLEMPAAED